MIYLIFTYSIIIAFLFGYKYDDSNTFIENIVILIITIFAPFIFLYGLLIKLYKNDYVFFIRVLWFNYNIKNNERLIYNINERRNIKSKLWNKLADKVINKLNK